MPKKAVKFDTKWAGWCTYGNIEEVYNEEYSSLVTGSLAVGFDAVNGESFGFDTFRMKENNLRMHFDDTSDPATSFPSRDWRGLAQRGAGSRHAQPVFFVTPKYSLQP